MIVKKLVVTHHAIKKVQIPQNVVDGLISTQFNVRTLVHIIK